MQILEKGLPNIEDIVKEPERKIAICSDGSGMETGQTNTKSKQNHNLRPDQVKDILSKMQSIELWRIQPTGQRVGKTVLQLLELSTIEASYDDIAYWIARLLAHFPSRETGKDSVIISDIAGACVEKKVSAVSVAHVCDSIWKNATNDNPFLPPSGEILEKIVDYFENLEIALRRLKNQPPPRIMIEQKQLENPYGERKWPDFTAEDKKRFAHEVKEFSPQALKMYRNIFDVPENFLELMEAES